MNIAKRHQEIIDRVTNATDIADKSLNDITIIAVCKRQPIEKIYRVYDLGYRHFGENTVQGLLNNAKLLIDSGRTEAKWHYIGKLQRNKINKIVTVSPLIHTIDSIKLASSLAERVTDSQRPINTLIQVNIDDERQKGGVKPSEVIELADFIAKQTTLKITGLMCIPKIDGDRYASYQLMNQLFNELTEKPYGNTIITLSMGMSGDFETAIKANANCIRIGSALFGPRTT